MNFVFSVDFFSFVPSVGDKLSEKGNGIKKSILPVRTIRVYSKMRELLFIPLRHQPFSEEASFTGKSHES